MVVGLWRIPQACLEILSGMEKLLANAAKQRQGAGILKAALSRQYFSRLPRKRMWERGVVNVGLHKGQLSLKTGVY